MAKLKSPDKELIVRQLACFEAPTDIQKKLLAEHEVDVSLSQILYYDPESAGGARLAKKWRHMFHDTRRKYIEQVSEVPIANKGFRLNEMQKAFEKAKRAGNLVLAMEILEKASREVGGMNERGNLTIGPDEGSNFYQQINNIIIQKDGN